MKENVEINRDCTGKSLEVEQLTDLFNQVLHTYGQEFPDSSQLPSSIGQLAENNLDRGIFLGTMQGLAMAEGQQNPTIILSGKRTIKLNVKQLSRVEFRPLTLREYLMCPIIGAQWFFDPKKFAWLGSEIYKGVNQGSRGLIGRFKK